MGTSRSHFLREAVSRLYEERICEAFSPATSVSASLRDMRRKRGESLAIELKKRRASLSPATPFSEENPMSRANTIIERLSSGQSSEQSTPVPEIHPAFRPVALSHSPAPASPNSLYAPSIASSVVPPSPSRTAPPPPPPQQHGLGLTLPPPPPNITVLVPGGLTTLPATVYQPPTINRPPIVNRYPTVNRAPAIYEPPTFNRAPAAYQSAAQHPFQIAMQSPDPSLHSPEKAIFRIVEMGFTAEEAKGALKITDLGDGLRVDRAVEYLLRQQGGY
jgi:hypothetical protein